MKDNELEQKLKAYFEEEADTLPFPAEDELKALVQKNKRKHVPMRKILTAAACFLLVACIAIVPFLHGYEIADSSSHGNNSNVLEQPSEDSESVGIIRPNDTAPWEDGSLRLTSVTYKGTALSQTNAMGGSWQFAAKTGNATENISISMLADTKISGCVNANLLSITPTEGEHVGCDGVYYDIRKDRIFCLACYIKEQIREDPYYIDICIRSLIEEHLITIEEILAGIIDYEQMYISLNNDTAKKCFAGGGELTCESLEFDYASSHTSTYDNLMADYQYPIIRVIEYGENEDRCLFTIGSPVSDATWGAYVFELDTGKVIKLDGETVGLAHSINGYMALTPDEFLTVNLLLATGVSVKEDYSTIIVTLPYFSAGYYETDDEGRLVNVYAGQNVIVFDVENGTYTGLLGNSPYQDLKKLDLPTAHAKSYGNVVYFPTENNAWCLFVNGQSYKLQGELLRLIERDGGGYHAVMKKGSSYEFYSLEGSQAALVENEAVYVLDGNKRVLLSDGSAEVLWESEPAAAAATADGRFVYAYFEGDSYITCLDIDSGERGQLALSEDFISQVSSLAHAEYLLFLNPSENRLLIAYYKKGALVFDSEAFLTNEFLLKDFDSTRICYAFEHNFKKTLSYYNNGETNVSFRDPDAVVKAATVLGFELLYDYAVQGIENDMSDLIVEVANRVAKVADYAGNSAEISTQTIDALLGGMTFDTFEERYTDLFEHFDTFDYGIHIGLSRPDENSVLMLAEDIASGVLTYVYGYVPLPESDLAYLQEYQPEQYEVYLELYRRLNEGIDTEQMDSLRERMADTLVPLLKDAGINENALSYTGEQLNALLEEHLADLVTIALNGVSYSEFIRSCGFAHPYDDAYYSGRTDKRFDSMLLSDKVQVDTEALRDWMADIEFIDGTAEIVREAGIYMEWELDLFDISYLMYPGTEVVAVGHDANGTAYAVISGSYAVISEVQFDAFYSLCGEGIPYDRDAGVFELLEQIRSEAD